MIHSFSVGLRVTINALIWLCRKVLSWCSSAICSCSMSIMVLVYGSCTLSVCIYVCSAVQMFDVMVPGCLRNSL